MSNRLNLLVLLGVLGLRKRTEVPVKVWSCDSAVKQMGVGPKIGLCSIKNVAHLIPLPNSVLFYFVGVQNDSRFRHFLTEKTDSSYLSNTPCFGSPSEQLLLAHSDLADLCRSCIFREGMGVVCLAVADIWRADPMLGTHAAGMSSADRAKRKVNPSQHVCFLTPSALDQISPYSEALFVGC